MVIDEAVNIQLKLDLFSWASLFYLIFELYLMPLFVRSVTTLDWTGSAFKLGSMCFVKAVLLFS